ncbi:MAG: tetrahedral aminopeptidase [Clostridiales bacterium]|jgi:endoglucanase|nr:tetrahedral aminopeptidase [Clostridiales bacterium]MDK2933399.1 tetrahedral aminopeptidase [Clostridiales bacterium]
MSTNDFLLTLSSLTAVSGYEHVSLTEIKKFFQPYCDLVYDDKMGNIIGVKKTKTKTPHKVMLAAHMDEIGLMVKSIDEKGFIKFTNIGGVDQRLLLAQEVIVHGKEELFGVISAKPPHLQSKEEANKAVKMEDLVIDVGMEAEKVKKLINIGDIVSFRSSLTTLMNKYICGKSMDNRVGVAVMIECLKELNRQDIDVELYAAATVQEEVGLRGATVISYDINPDIGIAIDVCHGDTPDVSKDETYVTSKGPVITLGPNIHPKLAKKIMNIAKEYNIPFQTDVDPGNTGTDAWAIQVTRAGIPTLLVSIPLRYMHTTVETVCYNDIANAGKLLAIFIRKLEGELGELLCY